MKNFITKVNICNKYIYLEYYNNYNKRLKYTEENKEKILNELKENKKNLIKYKEGLKKVLVFSNLFTLIDTTKTILSCMYLNNFTFNLFLSIISFYIVLINLLLNIFLKNELKGIKENLESINTSNLPNEIEYLRKSKIVDITKYIKRKKQQEEFNYYDYDYPGFDLNIYKKVINNNIDYGKVLEFKRK